MYKAVCMLFVTVLGLAVPAHGLPDSPLRWQQQEKVIISAVHPSIPFIKPGKGTYKIASLARALSAGLISMGLWVSLLCAAAGCVSGENPAPEEIRCLGLGMLITGLALESLVHYSAADNTMSQRG